MTVRKREVKKEGHQASTKDRQKSSMPLGRLRSTMDQMSDEAEANGLTPAILQAILNK